MLSSPQPPRSRPSLFSWNATGPAWSMPSTVTSSPPPTPPKPVIPHFTQHYKTFCGFQNIASARLYLGVFEKVYRFTPFSAAAHPAIRGRCPLELAGYQVHPLPITQLFPGLVLQRPTDAFQELVPYVSRSPFQACNVGASRDKMERQD